MNKEILLENYKRGVMDREEVIEEKLEEEMNEYREKLLELPKEKILENAYEYVTKSEIKEILSSMYLDDLDMRVIFDREDILSEFYDDWLGTDCEFSSSMEDCVFDSLKYVTKDYKKRHNIKNEKER